MSRTESQRRIRARIELDADELIHNDLGNAAYYFEQRVRERIAADDREGVGHEMVAALTMTAFAFEANINFFGSAIAKGWKERQPFDAKLAEVFAALGLKPDLATRPYASIAKLKRVRDMLAHGKPQKIIIDEEAIGTHDELAERLRNYQTVWGDLITPAFVTEAFQDVDAMWNEMLAASGIDPVETWSGAESGISFIGYADEEEVTQPGSSQTG